MRPPTSAGVTWAVIWLAASVAVTASSSISRASPGASARHDRPAPSSMAGASATDRPVASRACTRRCSAWARARAGADGGMRSARDSARRGAPPSSAASAARRRRCVACGPGGLSSAARARNVDSVQQGAAVMCHCRGAFQFGSDVLGGSEGGCGQVPGSGLLVVERTRRGGQHSVCLPPGRLRGAVVGRRPDDGVPETQVRHQVDQPAALGGPCGIRAEAGQFGCPPQRAGRGPQVGCGQQEQLARFLRDAADLRLIVAAKPVPDRERFVEQRRRRGAPGRELVADLDQGERVSLRPACDVPRHLPVHWDVTGGAEQKLHRFIKAEGMDGQFRDAAENTGLGLVTGREHHQDPLVLQPSRHEREHLGGFGVQPVGVVDEADERPEPGQVVQQCQYGQAEQERRGLGRAGQSQARVEGAGAARAAVPSGAPGGTAAAGAARPARSPPPTPALRCGWFRHRGPSSSRGPAAPTCQPPDRRSR